MNLSTQPQDTPAQEFKSFEYQGWQRSVDRYHAFFSPLTCQAVGAMLALLQVNAGDSLLDIACGPGHLSRDASARGVNTLGLDFSDGMLERARQTYPELKFQQGDAEAMELPENSFDAACMNFGLLHLAEPERAIAEAFRVLKPGGRFAFSVWAEPDRALGFQLVLDSVQKYGDASVQLPKGPPFFRYSDRAVSDSALKNAGFAAIDYEYLPLSWRLASPSELFDAYYHGTARTGGLLRAQPETHLAAIRACVESEAARRFQRDGVIEIPMPVHLFCGLRPPSKMRL